MTLTRSLARTGVVSRPKIIANTAKQNSPVFFIINLLWVIILPTQASVVRPTLLYISRMLKKVFTCHPERSEGSHVFEKARFFASLRMTIKVKRFMTHYTSDSQVLASTRGEAMGMKIIVCAKQVLDPETPSSIFSVKKRLPTPFLLHRNLL